MSLLMQALRKAERTRSHAGNASEPEHHFGQDAVPSPPPIEGGPAFAVMPDSWRLEPLDAEPPVIAAEEAAHDPVPPQARHEPSRPSHPRPNAPPAPPTVEGEYAAENIRAAGNTATGAPSAGEGPRRSPHANGIANSAGSRDIDERGYTAPGTGNRNTGGHRPGARPAASSRAIASSQRRLMALVGTLTALVAVFAFIYWRAVSGPGPGARLPMVPMPAPVASPPSPTGVPQASALPVTPYVAAPNNDLAAPVTDSAYAAPPGAAPTTTTAVAPASKPNAGVAIPTPEQLAAIPDPAIRAEAMRDAAERSARQVTMEGAQPSGTATGAAPPPTTMTQFAGTAATPEPAVTRHRRQQAPTAEQGAGAPPATQAAKARGRAAPPTAVGENGDVRFVRSTDASQVAPPIQHGYSALQAGDLATARQQYDLALLQDPNNRDALLGSAAVAMREHDGRQASANYLRLLELDPKDPEALAGLAELRPGDLQANEITLRGLAREHPESGPVQFALGNLYARQGRWPEAQQSYFRAFTAVPDNADYAFNLGVGLDRLNQPRLAKTYYRRALELAQTSPPGFNPDSVRKRLQAIETPAQ